MNGKVQKHVYLLDLKKKCYKSDKLAIIFKRGKITDMMSSF